MNKKQFEELLRNSRVPQLKGIKNIEDIEPKQMIQLSKYFCKFLPLWWNGKKYNENDKDDKVKIFKSICVSNFGDKYFNIWFHDIPHKIIKNWTGDLIYNIQENFEYWFPISDLNVIVYGEELRYMYLDKLYIWFNEDTYYEIQRSPHLKEIVEDFKRICNEDFKKIHTLQNFYKLIK